MNILRTLTIGLLSFVCVLALSGFVYLLTLNTTIMDRTVVKNWLSDSGVYDGKLIDAFVQTTNSSSEQAAGLESQGQLTVPPETIKAALNGTFTPDFMQTQAEATIDSTYDWIDGKQPTFAFSIPVNQKQDTLIQQLAKAVEPQVAALPVCTAALATAGTACRPASLTTAEMATQLATTNVQNSDLFNQPLTNESLPRTAPLSANQQTESSPLTQLPAVRSTINALLFILPIVIIASIAIVIAITPAANRLRAALRLSRRIFFSLVITFIGALAVHWIAKNNDLGLASMFAAQSSALGGIIDPLLQTVIGSISSQLAIFSGIVCGVSLASWIGFTVWQKKLRHTEALQPPTPAPAYIPAENEKSPNMLQ